MRHTITVKSVTVWPGGLEAQIDAALGKAGVSFFDSRYGEYRNRYRKDASLDFLLSAIAYACGPAERDTLDVTLPSEIWNAMSATGGEASSELSLAGASMLIPIEEWDCDDYRFRGPIQDVEEVEMLGRPAWIVIARVCQRIAETTSDPDHFDLPIVVTDKAWQHDAPPAVGQDIEGSMWLQGCLES